MKRLACITSFALLMLLASPPSAKGENSKQLERKLAGLIKSHKGDVAVSVKHLGTGERYDFQSQTPMPTASLIKVAVMIEVYRQAAAGRIDLEQLVELRDEDKVPGSGILTPHFSAGARISLRDAVQLMISYSDNTATNLVLAKTGLRPVAETMAGLRCPNTRINAMVFRRDTSIAPERSREFGLGSTTSQEMVSLLEKLHAKAVVSPQASEAMLEHLFSCDDKSKLASGLPDGVKLAHKSGAVSRARCDAGLMFTKDGVIAICVLTAKNEDRSWKTENAANQLCGRIAKRVVEHFSKSETKASLPVELAEGASGKIVEDLQRTLNERSGAELGVDGDFGPATKAAVQDWQRKKKLSVTGVVDSTTWKTLGPVVTSDPPVAEPKQINSEQLSKAAADTIDGPPIVSCKAWTILDRESGEALASHQPDQRLNFASTTKIMTAFVVLSWAAEHPGVLDEEVVFSERADKTAGSTAGIRAGEKLPVSELLYGLMLPSGNDASVALGEHFGAKFASDDPQGDDPLSRFIARMNATAERLGMKNTHFENTHGLTAKGHLSTAADLAKLARQAMQLPRFRQYVETRQRGCRLGSVAGYSRNVVWKNTNRLLRIEGFEGVKTGTTSAAGACLVSAAGRDGRQLLIVVLGASSSAARYIDSRNLYRWAWRDLVSSR